MIFRSLAIFSCLTGLTMASYGATDAYSDSSDGYDPSYYTEAYSNEYNNAPAPVAPSGTEGAKSFIPTQTYFEVLGPMDSSHGHTNIQNWQTDLNLLRMNSGDWGFTTTAAFRITWMNGSGADSMDVDTLYTIWLRMNASCVVKGQTRLIFGVTPQISTDFDTWTSKNIFLGAHALIAGPANERFTYGLGLGYYPQVGNWPFLPIIQFKWIMPSNWTLQLEGFRLSCTQKINDMFSWGPFVSAVSGSWTIHHERRIRQFQWISGAAGLSFACDLGRYPTIVADLGFTFGNSGKIKTSNGRHEIEKFHFDPGFYFRAGIEIPF